MLPIFQSSYFQDLLESFPNGVAIFNLDGEIYACNSEIDVILHTGGKGCDGRHWRELLAGVEEREELERFVAEVLDSGVCRLPLEVRYRRDDGNTVRLSLTAGVLSQYGKIFGVMLSITDVTHIYALHERETRMLNEMNELHRQRAEHLHKLSMAVAHQIRNPVMTIGGFARLLLKKAEQGEQEFLEGILDGSRRLEAIVREVSAFTSIAAGPLVRVDVAELLAGVRDRFQLKPGQHLTIETTIEEVTTDPKLLAGILAELVENSLEALDGANRQNGRVTLQAEATAEGATLFLVEDDGPGVDPVNLPFVFDPFFSTKAVGVGMGLTKAGRMAAELGGELTLSSDQGRGVTARVLLPARES